MLFTACRAQEGIDHHLQDSHTASYEKKGHYCRQVIGKNSKQERAGAGHRKCRDHHFLFAEPFDEHACGNGHYPVSNKKSKGKYSHQRQVEVKTIDDIRHQRADNIGQKRDHKKCQHYHADHVWASFHARTV